MNGRRNIFTTRRKQQVTHTVGLRFYICISYIQYRLYAQCEHNNHCPVCIFSDPDEPKQLSLYTRLCTIAEFCECNLELEPPKAQ